MAGDVVVPAARGAGLRRRAAVTASAVVASLVSQRVLLPFLDADALRQSFPGPALLSILTAGDLRSLSWGALGLRPFFAGFLLVEVIAVVVPALRPLRNGPAAERARLTRAAWGASLLIAAVQGWGLAVSLAGLRDTFGEPVLVPSFLPTLGVAAGAVLGTAALGAAAVLVSRHGVGNGFALLFAVEALQLVLDTALRASLVPRGMWTEAGALLVFAAAVLPVVLAMRPRGGASGPRIPVPTCGLWLLEGPAAIVSFPARLAAWLPAAAPLAAWMGRALRSDVAYALLAVPLTGALAFAFSRLFTPPAGVVRAHEAAAPELLDQGGIDSVRRALRSAEARSLALAVGVAALPEVASGLGVPVALHVGTLLAVFIVAAVIRDLRAEAAARAGGSALASVWPVHRVYAVDPVLQALSRAGIPAHARGLHYRTLFHAFAAYAPIEILVPAERAADAEVVCRPMVGAG
ncbi:MAG TPA: hypothetical protein VF841_17380 [Anaeromyxobacter sp.]